jgi:hypothetical protein
MRGAQTATIGAGARARPEWFRVACGVIFVEVLALVGLMVTPTSGDQVLPTARLAAVSDSGGGGADAAPPFAGKRPPPTTTVPPTTTTTTTTPPAPVTTVPPRVVTPPPRPAPAPAPAPPSGHAILPPHNPPANIAPAPNFLTACSSSGADNSSGCVSSVVAAIDNGRRAEGLAPMALPRNWASLTPAEQLFVATNLERTVRGLPALSAMATLLDQAAAAGAASGVDPSPPGGFPFEQWGGNWAGGVGSALEAVYYWMYDDGPGSSNADCTPSHSAGCWGHRDEILLALTCTPCVMGTGFAGRGWQGETSWAELLVGSSGSPAVDFTWQQELPYL